METKQMSQNKLALVALIPLVSLMLILMVSIIVLGQDPHIPLLLASTVAAITAIAIGYSWDKLQEGIIENIGVAMGAILILMVIGAVIAMWITSGVVPGLIYYGLDIISPKFFFVSAILLTSVIALATGSSWTAAGTIGIALIGISTALNIHIGWASGAIVSGAYFGDKMSPLSDTTNLAPAVAGTDVFSHIKSMLYTTVPAYIFTCVFFLFLGFVITGEGEADLSLVKDTQEILGSMFNIGIWIFIPPIIVIGLVVMKFPALPALFISALIGFAMTLMLTNDSMVDEYKYSYLGDDIEAAEAKIAEGTLSGEAIDHVSGFKATTIAAMDAMNYGFSPDAAAYVEEGSVSEEAVSNVNDLLERGGVQSMMWTISLIICAMVFGGIMDITGMLGAVVAQIIKLVFNYTALVTASILTSVLVNLVAADQYLAIVLPGKMYKDEFTKKYNVKPECFSRVLETGGTLTSPLVPWNTCGATMSGFLGVPVWGAGGYGFFLVFNYANIVAELIASAIGFGVVKADEK